MSSLFHRSVLGALALGISLLPFAPSAALAQQATTPGRCDWIGTATEPVTQVSGNQAILRMKIEQDLVNPDAVYEEPKTVQLNMGYETPYLTRYNSTIKEQTKVHISGFLRQGSQCVVDTLNVGTLEPGKEGYILPTGICLSAGSETISVSERASRQLGCAVSPPLSLETPSQPFQNGKMFYSRGIYVLQTAAPGLTSGAWSGTRDPFRDPEPEVLGMTPPAENLVEPRRGFGKTWRELYAGSEGMLGWATEDEHTEGASWQQFEKGLVIVMRSGAGYVLYYEDNTWEQRNR